MRRIIIYILFCIYCVGVNAQKLQKTDSGIIAETCGMVIEIDFYTPSIVRVMKYPVRTIPKKESLVVIKEKEKISWQLDSLSENELFLISNEVKVGYNRLTGKVSFFSINDLSLLNEKDYGTQFTKRHDGKECAYEVRQAFMLEPNEAIYGLGQHQKGLMNQRNQKLYLRQQNTEICIPFFQSIKGYGVYWDNYSPTTFIDNPQELSFNSEVGACSDYYFMYGQNMDGVVKDVRILTGRAPMFPLWTMGFWQCRERYKSQDELLDVVYNYRRLRIPFDGIVQDWQYWGDNDNWNSMRFDNPRFPNPKKMIDEVHRNNAHIMISVWPSFGVNTPIYKELESRGMLYDIVTWPMENVKPYDAFNPEARNIYWKYLKYLQELGIDAFWTDATEPDHFDIKESDFDLQTYLGSFRKVRNAYSLQTNGGIYEHYRKINPNKRLFLLTRSSFLGQQRYAAASWSGDVDASWENFKKQIPAGLNFSLCGIPYWNTDIGGFSPWQYPNGLKDPAYHELHVRWFQFGTFSGIMRSHNTIFPVELYQFGKKGDWVYDVQEKFINLRYRLLPYIYSMMWNVTSAGGSFMRALPMDFPDDVNVYNLGTEFLFGKSILVSPVTDSLYTKRTANGTIVSMDAVKSVPVYLPMGEKWYNFWTNESFDGGKIINCKAPIDIIPLYIKSGSILPMGPFVQYASEKKWDELEIRIYPGKDGSFILYEDEFDNYNYEEGSFSTIKFSWNDKEHTLIIDNRSGDYKGMLKKRKFKIAIISSENACGINDAKEYKSVNYVGKRIVVKL
ncbi:TIM-barrel domain-containing protein [uncultured Bacteroides sp.]|uniref:glycoside hydrolase family 31 protein n=1 Tax=uncultured Bacteroides sp. TaxID=162156 RepID=UPI00280A66B7|nr:TIM-barrel domain-containing protein [uncultured Bacteroides sp.]